MIQRRGLDEALDFDRTVLTLPIKKETIKTRQQKEAILLYLEKNSAITTTDAAALLHIGTTRVKTLLYQLVDAGKIEAQGDNKNRSYVPRR